VPIADVLREFIVNQPVHAAGLIMHYFKFRAHQPSGLKQLRESTWRAHLFELCQAAAAYLQQAVYAGLLTPSPPLPQGDANAAAAAPAVNGVTGAAEQVGGGEAATSSSADPSSSSSSKPAGEGLAWVPPLNQWLHPLLLQLHPLHVLQLTAQLLYFLGRKEQVLVGIDEQNMDSPLHAAVMVSLLRLLELLLICSRHRPCCRAQAPQASPSSSSSTWHRQVVAQGPLMYLSSRQRV
jgi:hypothetical protein